jgi:hypothetical protein
VRPAGIPDTAAAILARYAPLAAVLTDLFRKLRQDSRETPYPLEDIHRVSATYGLSVG